MISRHPPLIAVGLDDLAGLIAWQTAIDAVGFIAPIRLDELSFGSPTPSRASIAGQRAQFSAQRLDPSEFGVGSSAAACWGYAYAFGATHTLPAAVAASSVALAFAIACEGALLDAQKRPMRNFHVRRRSIDIALAGVSGISTERLIALYPELADEPSGLDETVIARTTRDALRQPTDTSVIVSRRP